MTSRRLDRLPVMVLDFQATASASRRGLLIEAAWGCWVPGMTLEGELAETETWRVRLPPGRSYPPGVRRVTGLSERELASGLKTGELARRLREALNRLEAGNGNGTPLVVVHYARFERPFLVDLLDLEPFARWPLELVCTHEISRRLFAFLPRRGLRAVSGYLGHSTPELRRSLDHVRATAAVWSKVLVQLREAGVETVSDLRRWLIHASPRRKQPRRYPMSSIRRLALPDCPGVYHLLRSNGDVLYVGKARSLKRRVNSYFQKRWRGNERALELLSQVQQVAVTPTPTSFQAALLEVQRIQQLQPPYNVALRSGRRRLFFLDRDLRPWPQAETGSLRRPWIILAERSPFLHLLPFVATLLQERMSCPEWPAGVHRPPGWEEGIAAFQRRWLPPAGLVGICSRLRRIARRLAEAQGEGDPGVKPLDFPAPKPSGTGEELSQVGLYQEVGPVFPDWGNRQIPEEDPGDGVVAFLELAAAWADRAIARSRWLNRLRNSLVSWPTQEGICRLEIVEGRIGLGEPGPARDLHLHPAPAPAEAWPSVESCDQLRVLTSEIRRGVGEGREVEVSFGARSALRGRNLQEALRWV